MWPSGMDEFSIIIITVTTYQSQISAEGLNEIHSMQYGMALNPSSKYTTTYINVINFGLDVSIRQAW